MMGLMVKDFRILKSQFKFYIALLAVALFMMIVNDNPFFVVSYMTMIFGFLSITAISYDEVDNGYSFLFTMPVRRKEYVLQKYIFACITTIGAGVISFVFLLIGLAKKGELADWSEYGFMTICFVMAVLIYVMIMLPIQLK